MILILDYLFYGVIVAVMAFLGGAIVGKAYYETKLKEIDLKYNLLIKKMNNELEKRIGNERN